MINHKYIVYKYHSIITEFIENFIVVNIYIFIPIVNYWYRWLFFWKMCYYYCIKNTESFYKCLQLYIYNINPYILWRIPKKNCCYVWMNWRLNRDLCTWIKQKKAARMVLKRRFSSANGEGCEPISLLGFQGGEVPRNGWVVGCHKKVGLSRNIGLMNR